MPWSLFFSFIFFRDLYLQSDSKNVFPCSDGHSQLAWGHGALLHCLLDSDFTEPAPGGPAVRQHQPAQVQRQAHLHQGEDAGPGGGDHEPAGGRDGRGQAGRASKLLPQHVKLHPWGGTVRRSHQNFSAEEVKWAKSLIVAAAALNKEREKNVHMKVSACLCRSVGHRPRNSRSFVAFAHNTGCRMHRHEVSALVQGPSLQHSYCTLMVFLSVDRLQVKSLDTFSFLTLQLSILQIDAKDVKDMNKMHAIMKQRKTYYITFKCFFFRKCSYF